MIYIYIYISLYIYIYTPVYIYTALRVTITNLHTSVDENENLKNQLNSLRYIYNNLKK